VHAHSSARKAALFSDRKKCFELAKFHGSPLQVQNE
jgi:hypothetical protein